MTGTCAVRESAFSSWRRSAPGPKWQTQVQEDSRRLKVPNEPGYPKAESTAVPS
jgi:hypothetical protein